MVGYNANDVVVYDAKEILPYFQEWWTGVEGIEEINEGDFNLSFTVATDQGLRFGKVHNPKKEESSLELELDFTNRLILGGIPAPSVVLTNNDRSYAKTDKGLITLNEFLEGSVYKHTRRERVAAAETQARIHNLGMGGLVEKFGGVDLVENPGRLVEEAEELIGKGINPQNLLGRAARWLSGYKAPVELMPKTIIHCDYHPFNVKFGSDGTVSGVFDFEFASPGRNLYDLAISLTYFGRTSDFKFDPSTATKKMRGYLEAYGQVKELTAEEKGQIPCLMSVRLVDNITRDLKGKDGNYELNESNKRNFKTLDWALGMIR